MLNIIRVVKPQQQWLRGYGYKSIARIQNWLDRYQRRSTTGTGSGAGELFVFVLLKKKRHVQCCCASKILI